MTTPIEQHVETLPHSPYELQRAAADEAYRSRYWRLRSERTRGTPARQRMYIRQANLCQQTAAALYARARQLLGVE